MNVYEKLWFCFKNQENKPFLLVGMMTDKNKCKINDQEYQADDLMIAEALRHRLCTKVNIDEYHKDNSDYMEPLKTGDMVLLYPISDTKFIILCKVVDL